MLNLSVSTFNDASTSYFHRSVGGYHGAKLHRYQDLIDRHLSKMNMNVYNMLNTRYVIVPDQQTGRLSVQHNPEANGAAWFVDSVAFVETPDLEIDALTTTDTKRVAVVDERFADALQGVVPAADSTASIRMTEYRVNLQRYEYTAPAEGVAVFSEIYLSARMDGLCRRRRGALFSCRLRAAGDGVAGGKPYGRVPFPRSALCGADGRYARLFAVAFGRAGRSRLRRGGTQTQTNGK